MSSKGRHDKKKTIERKCELRYDNVILEILTGKGRDL